MYLKNNATHTITLIYSELHLTKYNVCFEKNARKVLLLLAGPEVIKLFSCSTHLSMKFFWLINVKMPTIVGILTFMSRKNSIIHLPGSKKS